MRPSNLRPGLAAVTVFACLAAAPAAWAATSVYPPDREARQFGAGSGGWVASAEFGGCLESVTCPSVSSGYEPSGGAGGDGHLRSAFSGQLGVIGSATALWQSPTFTFRGAGGTSPETLHLALSRRSDVGDLIGVTGSSATFSADLVDVSDGGAVTSAIAPTPLAGAAEWTSASASLAPDSLILGHDYVLRLSATYLPGTVGVLVEGSADFDDVALTAAGRGPSTSPRPPSTAPRGPGLLALLRRGSPATAVLRGRRWVLVRVRCPRRAAAACRTTVVGKIGRRAVTRRRAFRVGRGRARVVSLKVRVRFRKRLSRRKRLLIVQRVRVGRERVRFARSRVLVKRR